jgi:hypothetical protein
LRMGADPIGALPAGQGNAERAKAMNQSLRSSDEAMNWPSVFLLRHCAWPQSN